MSYFGEKIAMSDRQRVLLKDIISKLNRAKSFWVSNNRLLIYSKHKIFFGSLLKVSNVADLDLILHESDFKINVMETRAEKKLRKKGLKHLKLKEQDLDFVLGDNDDFIEEIFSIRKAKKGKRSNVVIMIRSNNQKLVFIEYDLEGKDDQDANS